MLRTEGGSIVSAAETPAPASRVRPAARGRVLIVEEDRGTLEKYADLLLENGYAIAAARSSTVAARLLGDRGSSFDAVVTEAVSAGDADLLRAARERGAGIPVVFVTGNPSVETAVRALEMGALHYLVRPFPDAELLRCVDHATRVRRQSAPPSEDGPSREGAAVEDREELEARLTRAIESAYMVYQPILRARDRSVFGWEALLRTKEPSISGPLPLLALGERLGRVREVGRAVRSAVAAAAARTRGIVFFVNLHPDDLLDEDLYDPRAPLAARASEVVLEITEARPLDSLPDVGDRLARLRGLGYRIAVDDLGAGYATLTTIAALSPDFVKLDRGLVAGLDRDDVRDRLVSSVVHACRDLGLTVIAEGVETEAEQALLVTMGCDLVQGFLFRGSDELRTDEPLPLVANG